MLLLIDNLDSFSYNIVQLFQILGASVYLMRSSPFFSLEECLALRPTHLVIGPGPGAPLAYPYFSSLITAFSGKIPILGVCLGHQGIAESFGAQTIKAVRPIHGKSSLIQNTGEGIFNLLPQNFLAIRYNSLVVEPETFPSCLKVTARSNDGEIMALKHREYLIEGVQFHPESIGSECGHLLFQNFLNQSY